LFFPPIVGLLFISSYWIIAPYDFHTLTHY
jgi:hypothetical protein